MGGQEAKADTHMYGLKKVKRGGDDSGSGLNASVESWAKW
jgi:hypothetical protein